MKLSLMEKNKEKIKRKILNLTALAVAPIHLYMI
jgi:hypothetical protein